MKNVRDVAVALVCFAGRKSASSARKPLEGKLRSNGDAVLQTTVLQVDGKHKASVHDPRRVMAGTLTAALTWGLFGLVAGTNKLESTIVWAVIGAVCGGAWAYTSEHLLTKSELAQIGRSLAPDSSALLIYAETREPKRLLAAAGEYTPTAASLSVVGSDLSARVFAGASNPMEVQDTSSAAGAPMDQTSALGMLLYRYPDPKAAAHVARAAKGKPGTDGVPQIELIIATDDNGHRHVTDPTRGTAVWARSDVISWGLFGVVVGAIAGAVAGGGFHGAVTDALVTGIAWAIFGAVAGALYGLWAGRSISARRLRGIGSLLEPNSSALLAWADAPLRLDAVAAFDEPNAERLILLFNPTQGGAVLEAT
jgi:uncharacterized membrane protein